VQAFEYRGRKERSLPGQVTVLHPDEQHDGRAGSDSGFGYHIVYVSPASIGEAVRAITGNATPLPFAKQAVTNDRRLAYAVYEAFELGIREPLARDGLILRLAHGLLVADSSLARSGGNEHVDAQAVKRAREYLEAELRSVRSSELEAITGLSRYDLARQFRILFGTSPYRYSVLRRLDAAREQLRTGESLADVALSTGFSDQAHFTRTFTRSFGLPPGRYAQLQRKARGVTLAASSTSLE
jgi:AraC-like DNA-binding protein